MRIRTLAALPLFAALVPSSAVARQNTTLVSVDSAGLQGNASSQAPAIAEGGRFVVYASTAGNLVAGDTNARSDVFVFDRTSGITTRESVDSLGLQANSDSTAPVISSDGRYVAFQSSATNLIANDANFDSDIFLRDRVSLVTTRVSVSSTGAEANFVSFSPSISSDGRYVAFQSGASNLVSGDTNGWDDVFVRDTLTGTTTRVSVSSSGAEGNDISSSPSISGDGRFVAFHSYASTLVSADTNATPDIFVHDRSDSTTTRVSVDSNGVQGDNACHFHCAISSDGRFVAFASRASNLVTGDTNGFNDVFLRDRQHALTTRVSVSSSGTQANALAQWASISADGRFVAFRSAANNLVAGDTNAKADIFLRDVLAATTERVSIDSNGAQANLDSTSVSLSADGRYVAFDSLASNLVASDTNNASDVFVHDRGVICGSVSYCTAGTSTHGCIPSIQGSGMASSSAASGFTLIVSELEGQRTGLILYGLASNAAPWGAGGTSYLCIAAPQQRTGSMNSGGIDGHCDGTLSLDWNTWRAAHPAALGNRFSAGEFVFAQGWFRDPGAVKGTNLSNALRFTICN
jgi:hypothetical protein